MIHSFGRNTLVHRVTARQAPSLPLAALLRSVLIVALTVAWVGVTGDPGMSAPPATAPAQATSSTHHILVRYATPGGTGRTEGATPWVRVTVPNGMDPEGAMEQYSLSPAVVDVSQEYLYHALAAPNDPAYRFQWHLQKIDVEGAWAFGNGSGVTVAVLDSGVATGGWDLVCRTFVDPYNAFTKEATLAAVADDTGHGTFVTGTIAECTDNGVGAAGVAPGASILPVKVLNEGSGGSGEVANGILWAVDHGADVINLSLGRTCLDAWPACSDEAVDSAIEAAHRAGILVVVAAGNDGSPWVSYPASYPAAFAVGATTTIDTLASYSSHGVALDIVAPGGNSGDLDGNSLPDEIFQESFDANGWGILLEQGTSFAAPHVAGVAALALSIDRNLTVDELESILVTTAVDLGPTGWDPTYGAGRVDAAAAALAAVPAPTTGDSYFLGGSAAVSDTVATDVAALVGTVPSRLAGSDRYATAAAISKTFHPTGANKVYIVTGEGFSDGLGVSPVAAGDDAPVLLVTRSGMPQATATELARLAPSEIIIVGGLAVIDDSVADRLRDLTVGTVTRIAGPDRYATAAAVSRSAFSPGVGHVTLVTGEAYPDGLSAGPVAARLASPVLLTAKGHLPDATRAELVRLSPDVVVIAGGTSAVSSFVESSIRALGFAVQRISGSDRYATAAALSATFFAPGTRPTFLATGEAFPDALSGAAAAGNLGSPLLLTRTMSLPRSTRTELERLFP